MKKIFPFIASVIVLGTAIVLFVIQADSANSLFSANVEALADTENFQTIYVRHESTCSIYVGANTKIKLFNGTILQADASGVVTFDGKVECDAGGSSSCKPYECAEVFDVMF